MMSPDVNSKQWGCHQPPPTTLKSWSVDDHPGLNLTHEPENQRSTDMGNIDISNEMTAFFRNIFYKYCDEPAQRKCHGSTRQNRRGDNTDDDQYSDSDSDRDHLDGGIILPELIKLTLAQHRMILSLRDLNREADVQLRITNARLDLVEEELSLVRSGLAEQATPTLFSGVRMGTSFGGIERDMTGDYIPKFDLTDIGATLAAGPGPGSDFGHLRHHVRDRSPSQRSGSQRRRSPRPERCVQVPTWLARCVVPVAELTKKTSEEHVKRTRISYDGLGGQDPKMPLSTSIFSAPASQSTTTVTDETSESEALDLDSSTESSLDDSPETDFLPEPSLLGKLCGKMARLLLGM